MSDDYWQHYQGMYRPRFTQVPDMVIDELMPRLGHAEFKVLMVLVRRATDPLVGKRWGRFLRSWFR